MHHGDCVCRNVDKYPEATTTPGIVTVRLDAPLFFANTAHFENSIDRHISEGKEAAAAAGGEAAKWQKQETHLISSHLHFQHMPWAPRQHGTANMSPCASGRGWGAGGGVHELHILKCILQVTCIG